jgi:hypothetical protein
MGNKDFRQGGKMNSLLSPGRPLFSGRAHRLILTLTAFLVTAGSLLVPERARADILFAPALSYSTETQKVNGGTSVDNRLIVADFKLGYLFAENGLYLGGMYKYEDGSFLGGSVKANAIGASIGYVGAAFSLIATYHFLGERKVSSGGTDTKYTGVSGYQFDAAYVMPVSGGFSLGPQLTYRSTAYSKTQVGGSPQTSNKFEISNVQPGFAFFFKF